MKIPLKYNLVHILNFQEFYTPLVLSQVFEQASVQILESGENSPIGVQVWVLLPLRVIVDNRFNDYRLYLNSRFSNLKILYFFGINRLSSFPQKILLNNARKSLGIWPCIFHFRGDDLLEKLSWIKVKFNSDKFVADIRGIWAAERLLIDNIEIIHKDELFKFSVSNDLLKTMIENLKFSDGLTAVSGSLLILIKSISCYNKRSWVVPCSVKLESECNIPRQVKNGSFSFVLGYLGGTAVYQNLEDLILPLLNEVALLSDKVQFLFITHQPGKMLQIIEKSGLPLNRYQIKSVNQDQVHNELKNIDLGMLIRKYNLVNSVAQPVKIGEYLSAGVPVCIEGNMGGLNLDSEAILRLDITNSGLKMAASEILNFLESKNLDRIKTTAFILAKEKFSWSNNIKIHRSNYIKLLSNT